MLFALFRETFLWFASTALYCLERNKHSIFVPGTVTNSLFLCNLVLVWTSCWLVCSSSPFGSTLIILLLLWEVSHSQMGFIEVSLLNLLWSPWICKQIGIYWRGVNVFGWKEKLFVNILSLFPLFFHCFKYFHFSFFCIYIILALVLLHCP